MTTLVLLYGPLLSAVLVGSGLAFSQYIALRAGVFSVATAGFAAIGAFGSVILVMQYGVPAWLSLAAMTLVTAGVGLALSVPLAVLRGVYQAIASLAFVQIVMALILYFEHVTGGAMGIANVPRVVGPGVLLVAVALVWLVLWKAGKSRIGRAFDAMRENEFVATSLGISVSRHQSLAFALSGAIGGLFGGLQAFNTFAITPDFYGFHLIVVVLTYVVLGGRNTLAGPIVGAAMLVVLPELTRPFGDYRTMISGVLLMLVVAWMPEGIVGTITEAVRRRRRALRLNLTADAERA